MPKTTTAISIIFIWLITLVSIASICKVADIPLPIIGKILGWQWLKVLVEIGSALFE